MQKLIQVPLTKGNYDRLAAIAKAMRITPERALNDFVLAYMQGPDSYGFDMLDPRQERDPNDFTKEESEIIAALRKLDFNGWEAETLRERRRTA